MLENTGGEGCTTNGLVIVVVVADGRFEATVDVLVKVTMVDLDTDSDATDVV